jgi:hypothetical protein
MHEALDEVLDSISVLQEKKEKEFPNILVPYNVTVFS